MPLTAKSGYVYDGMGRLSRQVVNLNHRPYVVRYTKDVQIVQGVRVLAVADADRGEIRLSVEMRLALVDAISLARRADRS